MEDLFEMLTETEGEESDQIAVRVGIRMKIRAMKPYAPSPSHAVLTKPWIMKYRQ